MANIVEQVWLNRCPWPEKVVLDRGGEFMAEFTRMIQDDCGLKKKPITKRNPQANATVERVHQTVGNMIGTFQLQKSQVDEEKPWNGILTAAAFAVRATLHTTTRATPMQLVFGRDAMLNIPFTANWKHIEQRKQRQMSKDNVRENSTRKEHQCLPGDQVLIKQAQSTKFGKDNYKGPFTVVTADGANATVDEGNITDICNIRQLKPHCSKAKRQRRFFP